ncbi:hypothetical protein AGMMS50293_03740 [Spirochaetia bacterium]|nr:hypothetical protein AGMMS50293_03740 [Spirochaetia bacterium]
MQKNDRPKKSSIISAIIASFCIIVYLVALVSALIRIYISVDERRIVAEREFFDIADLASSAGVLGFMDEPFIETITDALGSSRTLEALIITGPNGEYAFERQKDSAINWVNNSPRFKNRLDFSRQPLYLPLRIQNMRNVNIEARAGALDYGLLTGICKETLLLVLCGLVLAFFTLLLESLLGKSGEKQRYAPFNETSPVDNTVVDSAVGEPAVGESAVDERTDGERTVEDSPKGLYSPHGNIGWEEYTVDRLESELHRCASFEQDLTLVMMEFKSPVDDRFFNQFAEDAIHYFTLRDLIFEKGKNGISVIYPNIDLETGFAKAEEFHNRILSKYAGVVRSKTDFCAGLSSRSGRLIDAERLMFEANEALERALSDPVSHIVAFKSDPEKYRAFIASQNRRQS